ncbi:serine/arginine repetitive matrix protein 1-like [Stylophora pistillata]|uniref:serine/arginine repetitive matrix protein 1-like n=1 Tax=Stylophora pistillata TaxID=50429 RepID=UPI000C04F485|nr:serine/arginine repetitive matrix protein 1-like [Stylophora pistillata]
MSFLKKIQKKGRGKNHRELYFRAAAPSPTLECAKDESIFNKKETTKEESRKLSRPESLKNFQDDNRSRDITSSAACSKEATPKVITAPRAPLSEAVGDDEKKEEEKAHADTKGNGPKADSCRSNKTRSGSITVNRKAPLPPTSDRPSVSHPSPCQSAPPRRIPVRPAPPRRPRPARPPPPTVTQRGKKSGTASNAVDKGPCSVKKKANEICKYPKELNPFANCNSTTDDDCSSQKSEEAFGTSHQRQRKRQKYSKREEYPMKKNSLDDADEMSEKVPGTRRQRRKGKQKESKSEEYLIEGSDCPSSDVDEMSEKPSSARRKRRTRKRKESKNEEFLIGQNPSNDTDWGKSSSCSDSTETSDMWSVSSLEDIQFAVNTAAIPELNVKNAEQGLAGNNEKDAQINREDSGDLKAHSFPSCREVSSVNVPSTKKGNDSASIRSTNVDASTAKEFKDADEKPILKQAKASEEASAMEERQGGDDCGKL